MRDLRSRYSYDQRLELQETISVLRPYILHVLMAKQGHICNRCKKPAEKYDIDHKLYNPMMTINELQALCVQCHKDITNFTPFRNR